MFVKPAGNENEIYWNFSQTVGQQFLASFSIKKFKNASKTILFTFQFKDFLQLNTYVQFSIEFSIKNHVWSRN